MKRFPTRNYPLYIGLVLTALFVIVAIIGPQLAPHDPLQVFDDVIFVGDEVYIPSRMPVPPAELPEFVLGNDVAGRDLLSRILWAIRPTLLLCFTIAAIRLIVGVILGLMSGWFGGTVGRTIDALIEICLAVPVLIFALALIIFLEDRSLTDFVLGLTLTGWASTAVFVKNSTLIIRQASFIEGARAIGVRPYRMLRFHILPQLWPALPALIAFELSATLLVIAELGFLGLFIGESFLRTIESGIHAGVVAVGLTAGYPELSQMLSDFWSKMIRTPWEVAIVGLLIFLQIFAFNMLGEGLRRHMDHTRPHYSRWRRWRERKALSAPKV